MTDLSPEFLETDEVLEIHRTQLAEFGGAEGIRDPGLLESALAQPRATFEGRFLHDDLFSQAAAYLFHISGNHPFVDGNKRTALLAALVFLDLNGIVIDTGSSELYDLAMGVAEGRIGKTDAGAVLRRLAQGS